MTQLLTTLSNGAPLTFQTFDDNADRKSASLARQFHGMYDDVADELHKLNAQGAGVYVTVNATDGRGRKRENITGVRTLFVDFDTADSERPKRLLQLPLPPTIIVESSQDKPHAYWMVDDLPTADFTDCQKRLIAYFTHLGDAPDKSIHDLPRVMRVDGFIHHKIKNGVESAPFTTRTLHIGKAYSCDELMAWLVSLQLHQRNFITFHYAKLS